MQVCYFRCPIMREALTLAMFKMDGWTKSSRSHDLNRTYTMLRVAVNSAVNLPNIETIGKSDPYVVINFQGLS